MRKILCVLAPWFLVGNAVADNLTTCLDGRYPALCKLDQLNRDQLEMVRQAEHTANLSTCLDGRYPALCRHGELSPDEAVRVRVAEHSANLNVCLDGRYPILCRHGDLTPDELARVKEAEALSPRPAARQVGPAHPAPIEPRARASGCEGGHWVISVADDGGIVKLEDGSVWKVDAADTIESILWLPVTEIVSCDGRLINADDDETVSAERIR